MGPAPRDPTLIRQGAARDPNAQAHLNQASGSKSALNANSSSDRPRSLRCIHFPAKWVSIKVYPHEPNADVLGGK